MKGSTPQGVLALGPIQVATGPDIRPVGRGVTGRLLAAFASRANATVSRDHLIELLWPRDPPAKATTALQVQVHRLRKLLESDHNGAGPAIVTVHEGYRLDADESCLDVLAFEALVDRSRLLIHERRWTDARDVLLEALGLWRGEPFGGLVIDPVEQSRTMGLEDARLDAEEALSQALRESAPHDLDVVRLRRLVDESPFRERRWADLMLGLYRSGRQAEALKVYREAATFLGEELGVEPGPELRTLEERILLHDPGLGTDSPAWRSNLPAFPDRLIGREDEASRLAGAIRSARLITLTGLGGVGKTRLAVESVTRAMPAFRDGVMYVDLSRLDADSTVDEFVIRRLPARPSATRPALDVLVDAVRDRQMLVVLDNAEHVATSAGTVASSLIRHCPRTHVVVTSRLPLGVSGEGLWPVGPLPLPDPESGEGGSPSLDMLVEVAQRFRPGFRLGAGEATAASAICRLTGGIPLALELAGAALRVCSVDELARRLGENALAVDGDTPDGRSLGGVLHWTLGRLTPEQRTALAALSVFRGGWDAEAARAVLGPAGSSETEIAGLVDASLISFDPTAGRYSMLEPVRDAAFSLDPEVVETAITAHTRHFTTRAQHALFELSGPRQAELYDQLALDHDNYRAMLERALARAQPHALGALPTLGKLWARHTRAREGGRWFDRIEAHFDLLEHGEPIAAIQSAHNAMWAGRPNVSEERLARVDAFARRLGVPALLGQALHSQANLIAFGRGRPADSLDLYRSAHRTLREAHHPLAVVSALSEAYMAIRTGDTTRAREVLPSAVEAGELTDLLGTIGTDQVLGQLALYEGEIEEAERLLTRSLHGVEAAGLNTFRGPSLVPLVWTSVLAGRLDEARRRAEDCHRFVTTEAGGWRLGEACAALGLVELAAGNTAAATGWFTRGMRAAAEAPELDLMVWNAAGLVEAASWPGDGHRTQAAALARRLRMDLRLAVPAGAEALYPILGSTEPAPSRVTPAALRHAFRDVLVG